jgi:hypothetical protein
MKYMSVSTKRPKVKVPKLRHSHKPINGLLRELMAHKKISLPGRGEDKDKIIL